MDTATILIGFAQIAVSLAAFTTIAAVVVQISATTSATLFAVRLKLILLFSICLIVLSLLPIVTSQRFEDSKLWWNLAALGGSAIIAITAFIAMATCLLPVLRDPKNAWWQTIGVFVFGFGSVGSMGVAAFHPSPAFWYILSIELLLAATLVMVSGLLLSFPVFDVIRRAHETVPSADASKET